MEEAFIHILTSNPRSEGNAGIEGASNYIYVVKENNWKTSAAAKTALWDWHRGIDQANLWIVVSKGVCMYLKIITYCGIK